MTNLKNRIIAIEKKTIPKQEKEIVSLLARAWKRDNKTYYRSRDGLEKEFIQNEHKESPIFMYYENEKEAYPITNL